MRAVAGGWAHRISNPHEQANLMKITDSSRRTFGSSTDRRRVRIHGGRDRNLDPCSRSRAIIPSDAARRGMAGEILRADPQLRPRRRTSRAKVAALKAIVAKRSADDVARFRWWATGGPALSLERDHPRRDAGRHSSRFPSRRVISRFSMPHWTMRCRLRGTTAGPGHVPSPSQSTLHSRRRTLFGFVCVRARRRGRSCGRCAELSVSRPRRPLLRKGGRRRSRRACSPVSNFRMKSLPDARSGRASQPWRSPAARPTEAISKWSGSVPEGPGSWKGTHAGCACGLEAGKLGCLQRRANSGPSAPPAFDFDQVKAALIELVELYADAQVQPSCNLLGGSWRRACAHVVEREARSQASGETALRLRPRRVCLPRSTSPLPMPAPPEGKPSIPTGTSGRRSPLPS